MRIAIAHDIRTEKVLETILRDMRRHNPPMTQLYIVGGSPHPKEIHLCCKEYGIQRMGSEHTITSKSDSISKVELICRQSSYGPNAAPPGVRPDDYGRIHAKGILDYIGDGEVRVIGQPGERPHLFYPAAGQYPNFTTLNPREQKRRSTVPVVFPDTKMIVTTPTALQTNGSRQTHLTYLSINTAGVVAAHFVLLTK